jgi:hypothetical protein
MPQRIKNAFAADGGAALLAAKASALGAVEAFAPDAALVRLFFDIGKSQSVNKASAIAHFVLMAGLPYPAINPALATPGPPSNAMLRPVRQAQGRQGYAWHGKNSNRLAVPSVALAKEGNIV